MIRYLKYLVLLFLCPVTWSAMPQRNVNAIEHSNAATPGKRVALVLANSNYRSLNRLANPLNDAALIEKTLVGLGFDIVGGTATGLNLITVDMDARLAEFLQKSIGAETALVFFAGHGIEDRSGEQYMVGIEHIASSPERLKREGLALGDVMKTLGDSRAANNIVLLDACREKSRGTGNRSVKPTVDIPNTVIFYATAGGDLAADGRGNNSPFTKAVAEAMTVPGAEWR